ncbi:MAG: (Fe-S)-binding protein [bacterium]|nr:(Fe-S)-binding protein [bacterium]MDT8395909.1 (Fe-S)-binding protein [bacterium]
MPDRGPRSERDCVKCGSCFPVCPVYEAGGLESFSPRGKMALIESVHLGQLGETDRYREYIGTCLLCGACEEACPNEVPTLPVMLKAREAMTSHAGLRFGKGIILNHLLGAARTFRVAMRTGWFFQKFLFHRIPEDSGLRRRFPLPLIARDRTVPPVARYFFTELFQELVREGYGPRVGIFGGCMVNYFYPEIGETMVNILGSLGTTVVVPEGQVCCGMPALTGGARETVGELAVKNLEAFEKHDLDFIVTGCASCGGNLKHNYLEFLKEAGILEARARAFVEKVYDINSFLTRSGLAAHFRDTEVQVEREPLRVTYHHPCHLARLQGIREAPIRLIESLPGVQYVPMVDAERCCGMGGSFSIEHYDLARKVNDNKIDRIVETGAEAVVTSCPACIMHIRDGLRRRGMEAIEVLHVTELIARRMRVISELKARSGDVPVERITKAAG